MVEEDKYDDRQFLEGRQPEKIFYAMRKGLEPAIVECYDEKEAKVLPKLRDKNRQGK
ncbi:MAG: hypothetical protein II032_00450 [Treponema sp.]|nr:hypothetical protein [Treponema sp.]